MQGLLVNRIIPGFLFATAVAVFANLILTPAYHDGSPDYPVWKALNWPMAVSVALIMIVSYIRYRTAKRSDSDPMGSLRASIVFYGAIVLTMIFFWNWIWTLNPDSETGEAVTSHMIHFPLADAMMTVLGISAAKYLWQDGE